MPLAPAGLAREGYRVTSGGDAACAPRPRAGDCWAERIGATTGAAATSCGEAVTIRRHQGHLPYIVEGHAGHDAGKKEDKRHASERTSGSSDNCRIPARSCSARRDGASSTQVRARRRPHRHRRARSRPSPQGLGGSATQGAQGLRRRSASFRRFSGAAGAATKDRGGAPAHHRAAYLKGAAGG